MKQIALTQGYVALVDDDDFEKLSKYKWHINKSKGKIYAVATIMMHKVVLENADSMFVVDHKDNNGLNNQRDNLRLATHSQNNANKNKGRTTDRVFSSKYKGVTWIKSKNKWGVQICVNYKNYNLGYADTEAEAARKYNEGARKYFGEYARLNEV